VTCSARTLCSKCGHQFIPNILHRCPVAPCRPADLLEDLRVTELLLADRQRVIDAIPECPAHGPNCVPHAVGWVREQLRPYNSRNDMGR